MRTQRRGWSDLAWHFAVTAAVAWSLLWLVGGGWMLGDIVVAFQAPALVCVVVLGLVALAGERWRAAGLIGAAMVIGATPLVRGRSGVTPGVDLTTAPAPGMLRLVSYNIHPKNPDWKSDLDEIMSWHPDVIILIEVPADLWRAIVREGKFAGTEWPSFTLRAWVAQSSSPCFVLSRWPVEKLAFKGIPDADRDVLIARVDRPDGAFMVGTIHPHSPRTLWRWRQGNRQIRTTELALGEAVASEGLAYLGGVDLNSGPGGGRARALRGMGLRMSKPLLGGWGSFPAGVPGPLRIQLDDVWRSAGVEVLGWSSPGGLSSDHRPVVVDVRLPG